jgi:hypothetical protein
MIGRLTDLERIATLPAEGESCKLWSSYDRKSHYDQKTGKYVNWDSNGDGFGGDGWIRKEKGKLVLAEMEGPGCIWRIWSATPKDGHVRIYLDGSDTPAVDLPFVDYFNCTQPPFNRPALVYHVASGKNNFVPIPFAKSCKIVADKDYGEFHHFTYTLYPKDTVVPTFSMKLSQEEGAALDAANQRLSNRGADFAAAFYPNAKNEKHTLDIKPGGSQQITLSGARAIISLKIHVRDLPESIEKQREVLRQLVLSIAWDSRAEPAVWSPLGDFFGTGPGMNLYKSLPLGMIRDGFYSNWFMPFAEKAELTFSNDGTQNQTIELAITHTSLKKPADTYGRFHAKWHRDAFLPKEAERWIDWPMLTTQGQGRFVGANLQIWNPKGGWWGEGDEKFFVDGEKFPSTYGTGSEDYFGYAWSDGALFEAAYHCQPLSENNAGHISVARWHIVDNIPFQKSFEGCIEKYWADVRPTQYACVAYWYLNDAGTDAYTPVELSQRIGYYTQLKYPLEVDGTIVLEKPAGHLEAQWVGNHPAAKWDDDRHLWWTPEKVGDRIKLLVDAPADGSYKLITCLTKANDYAIVQLILNDEKIGGPVDLYDKKVTNTGRIDLGVYPLKKGQNVLTVEIVGSNPQAIKRYMFGMDYLKIQPQSASSAEENNKPAFNVGPFIHIYNPSVGEKEPWYINDHTFVYGPDKQWHLFGITRQEPMSPADEDNFAHAVSDDLYTTTGWTKKSFALSTDSNAGEAHLWAPYVFEHNGLYYMYYCAGGRSSHEYQLKLATSKDLYAWQRHPANPMFVDGFDARDPFILRLADKWVMYYTATSTPQGGNHNVCAIESQDLIRWGNKKVVFTDPSTGTWGGPTESPFVVRRGKFYYLFIGPRDGYKGTCVYRSEDPLNWTIEQEVGKIDSHAAEVVRDKDGKWYVSHCGWGQGGVFLAPLTWHDGQDDADTSLRPAGSLAAADGQTVRIPMEVYRNKMIAGWLGQMVAVAWGFPVEFKYQGEMIPEADVPVWKPEMINHSFEQDDLYVEMTFLKTLEDYGLNASVRQAGIDFANSLYPLWHANEAGRINLRKGIAPTDAGHPKFNSHADDIDYQIEADFAGLISPALPNHAVTLGNTFGRLMNYGDGLYGGHFVAAMYSVAFTENDPQKIVSEALKYIPYESQYAEAIRDVIAWHKQHPDDWTKTWELVNQKYHLNPDYRAFSCDKGKFNIDAKINGAYIVMGLLYGQGNIEKTIIISMRCGQDCDCNPANAAGILFTTMGYKNLPEIYKAFDKTKKFIYTPYNMPELFDVCQSLAHQAVKRCGGTIEKDASGKETLVIPVGAPRPNSIERAFDAGPIANSRYTPEEMSQIKTELRLDIEQTKPAAKAESVFQSFVKAQGDQLVDENGPVRFISFNVPNLHVNEDQMDFTQTNAWSLTDPFEITDALESVRQMGGQVIRLYTLTISSKDDPVGAPRHITAPGQFNEDAFKSLDVALAVANQKGVRLIIPFIDNHKWFGGVPAMAAFRGKKTSAFWKDEQLFEDYKQIVSYLVNRTNTVTGEKYKDDKAILAWETGNELASPHAWATRAAAFIKSIDSNHLVIDGTLLTELRDNAIKDANIDIVTTHHYAKNPKKTISQIQKSVRKSKGLKPYFIGEFGFVPVKDVKMILDEVAGNEAISGALLWSLRFHNSAGGFYWHSEPYGGDLFKAYHYPGFASGSAYDEIETLQLMRRMGFGIRKMEVPTIEIPAAPVLLDITDPAAISWQGSTGAQSYHVERADGKDGPWTVVGDNIIDADVQYRPLFADSRAVVGKQYYYRVVAKNTAGASQPSNIAGPVDVAYQTLVDEMANLAKIHSTTGRLTPDAKLARRFKEDVNRLEGRKGATIVYKTNSIISAFKLYCFFEKKAGSLKFSGSADGADFVELPVKTNNYFTDKGGYDYTVPVLYEGAVSAQQKIQYLKIEFADTAQLSRIEIQYGRQ